MKVTMATRKPNFSTEEVEVLVNAVVAPSSPSPTHEEQQPEGSAGSSHPYRRAAVCVGLLCVLLLTATLVLCVLYTSLSQTYSLLERELEELRAGNSTMTQERDQLQRNYSILQLAVLKKLPFIDQYCPISSQKRECKPCPLGWEQSGSKCYFFSPDSKIWTGSRSDCIKRGADLVIIKSKEEQDFISRNLRYNYYWIGLSNTVTEGTLLWVDGSPLQGGFWRRGDPNDQDHYRGRDCVATVPTDKAWIDTDCKKSYRFICEADALLH